MKRQALLGAMGLLLVLLGISPAIAQNQSTDSGTPKVENSQKTDDAKDKERKEEQRKKEEARVEAEKRKKAEERKRREAEEAARAKEDSMRKEEERKAQERKDQEKKEQARKAEEDKRKEEDRKREEDKRKQDQARMEAEKNRKAEEDKRRENISKVEDDKHKDKDRPKDEAHEREDRPGGNQDNKTEEERRKEREVRLEVEKRRQIEREQERRREHVDYIPVNQTGPVVIVTPQPTDNGGTVYVPAPDNGGSGSPSGTARVPGVSYPPRAYRSEPVAPKSYVSVLFSPGHGDRKPAIGLQYLTKNYGVGAWFSGSLGHDDDVYDATIPHDDYYTTSRVGTYGVEALACVGSDSAMLIFGAGISVQKTTYTDVSNVTGWEWDGGSTSDVKPAAQIGCRFSLGGRVSLQMGYDTAQSAFFGLSAGF